MSTKESTTQSAAPQPPRMTLVNPTQPGPYKPLSPGCKVPFHVVQAHRFELVDGQGRIRGGLGFTDAGDPTVMLVDAPGTKGERMLRVRAELRLDHEGPVLLFTDARRTHRLTIGLKEKMVGICFWDAPGQPRLMLGVDPKLGVVCEAFTKQGASLRPRTQQAGRTRPKAKPPAA